ncbi:MAG TPA: ELWxxDGT repeat protein, partial [Planctomycetaceae bacterium]|nr:ELWxxDGT repeat protein [Planctomycetaceae bacterium]
PSTWPFNSSPQSLTNVAGTLYFTADDGVHGRELWKSNGTPEGTTMVTDIPGNFDVGILANINGTLYLSANGLWKSDGTAAGTVAVSSVIPSSLTSVDGTLYFRGYDSAHGGELWKTDGTTAGTMLVMDVKPGVAGSYPGSLTNVNGTLLFTADDGVHGNELWALNTAAPPVTTISLSVSGFPATTMAGSPGSFTVMAKNADGTTNTGYVGKIHFTSTDPKAVLPADYTFTAADLGVHTFTASLKTAGAQSITATDTQTPGTSGTASNILVKPAAASTMSLGGFPATTAGVPHNFTVTLKDPYGNIATGYAGTVRFTSNDSKAVLPANYTFTAADAGTHTFSATLKTSGTRSITATDTQRSSLAATQGGITVTAATASKFAITAPSSVKAGAAFSLIVTVQDAYGNVVVGYTGKVHFSSTDRKAALPADYTFTAADKGVHTFAGLVLRTKGTQKITVTDMQNGSLTASLTESVK